MNGAGDAEGEDGQRIEVGKCGGIEESGLF